MKDVLLVDDDRRILDTVGECLGRSGLTFETASCCEEAMSALRSQDFRLVMTDIKMPGEDGFSLLRQVKESWPDVEVLVLTAFGSVEDAVRALRDGAYDYILKPFDRDALDAAVARALEKSRLIDETQRLKRLLSDKYHFQNIVTRDERLLKTLELLETVGDSGATILITGETGTGKELVARSVHFNGNRKNRPFVKVNCSAIPEGLLESELFGHEKGAFTHATSRRIGKFEHANGGTVFLDEVADIPKSIQVKLLRVLEQKEFERVGSNETIHVNVRVIAATNCDPAKAVVDGRLREDLYHRLNVIPVRLPPLRERKGDIPLLVDHFLDRLNRARKADSVRGRNADRKDQTLSPETLKILAAYEWPGNVREMENLLERLSIVVKAPVLRPSDLPEHMKKTAVSGDGASSTLALAEIERDHILRVFRSCRGNILKAAQTLGIDRSTLARRLRRYGAGPPPARKP
jgi:two-component system NtrC family response regulator/two-component system response regulator AtoC